MALSDDRTQNSVEDQEAQKISGQPGRKLEKLPQVTFVQVMTRFLSHAFPRLG